MDRFISQFQGLICFLLLQAIAVGLALVRNDRRLSILEGEMKDVKKEIDDITRAVTDLKAAFADMKADTGIIKERLTHISTMTDDVKHVLEKTFEMRPRT